MALVTIIADARVYTVEEFALTIINTPVWKLEAARYPSPAATGGTTAAASARASSG